MGVEGPLVCDEIEAGRKRREDNPFVEFRVVSPALWWIGIRNGLPDILGAQVPQ
jgi:hypothetical protein